MINIKKTILAISIGGFVLANASNSYYTVISKDNSNYDVNLNHSIVTETGDWIASDLPTCTYDIETDDLYSGKISSQTETCDTPEEKLTTTKKVYNDGTEIIIDTSIETRTTQSTNIKTITGTHVEPTCQDILLFDPSFRNQDGNYPANPSGQGMTVICDMTRDGGGWTKVANIGTQTTVVESSVWLSTGHFINNNSSMAKLFFETTNPEAIMFDNTSPTDLGGANDMIIVARNNATWNWTVYNHNNDSSQSTRFYDHSNNSWHNLGATKYAAHSGSPWQQSAFSFTLDLPNGYTGNYDKRVILGGTFSSSQDNGYMHSFYGNPASMYPETYGAWYGFNGANGSSSIWMK